MSRCVILSAGPVEQPAELATLLRSDDYVLAADGGWRLAQRLGVTPSAVVADFDSLIDTPLPGGVQVIHLPVQKDVTDTAAAAEYAYEAGFREFLLLGCTGGRLDHQHAALLTMVALTRRGAQAVLADERNRIMATVHSPYYVEPMDGWSLSLFAFDGAVEGLTLQGMAYPLSAYTLTPVDPLCVSNACTGTMGEIQFRRGTLLIYRSKD